MSNATCKAIGIISLVVCAISLFVAWERYQDNAAKVAATNKMMRSSPLGGMMQQMTGGAELEPGTPTATKYGLALAVLSGIGGIVCLSIPAKNSGRGRYNRKSASSSMPDQLPADIEASPSTEESLKDLEQKT
jgi:hypothetical protein